MAETSTSAPASTSAPVTSAAPVSASTPALTTSIPLSTADIAADVIADLDGGGDDNTPPTTPVPAVPTAPIAATSTADPDDIDALPAETVDSLGHKRVNSIPLPRVKEMRTKSEQKLLAGIAKELGLTPAQGAALKLDDIVNTIKEHGTKRTGYESRLQQMDTVEKLIKEDPDRFIEIIGGINPAYKEFARKQATAAAAAAATPVAEDPEPQPDYDLGEGNMTYSLKGLRDLRAWERRQAKKEIMDELAPRLKPFEDRIKSDKDREEEQQFANERTANINARVERARKWPQFTENEQGMLDAMKAAQKAGTPISFEDAYMQVVVPKLAGDRTKIRAEVLAEIEAVPKTSSVTTTAAVKPANDGKPKTTADIAREVIASMG